MIMEEVSSVDLDLNCKVPPPPPPHSSPTVSKDGSVTSNLGHVVKEVDRSEDVLLCGEDEDTDFRGFGLSDEIVRGLRREGFEKPSPIQLGAIPIATLGHDMLMQAKSGTGKTCVFSVVALERTLTSIQKIQVLVVCPSREIAVQTQYVIQCLGYYKEGLSVEIFIGGCPVAEDKGKLNNCHIAVGTPGRIVHMIRDFGLDLSSLNVFVVDEADKLLEPSFSDDFELIMDSIPPEVQILAVSATFQDGIGQRVSTFLKNPVTVQLDVGGCSLIGVKQFAMDVRKVYDFVPEEGQSVKVEQIHELKLRAVLDLLKHVPYGQAIIFSAYQLKAERIYDDLCEKNIGVTLLSGSLSQPKRLEAFRKFKEDQCDVMIATDLAGRGLDYEHVNLVINFETPPDLTTYLHRMGRSGRFGSFGRVVTLLGYGSDMTTLTKLQLKGELSITLVKSMDGLMKIVSAPPPTFDDFFGQHQGVGDKLIAVDRRTGVPMTLSVGEALEFLETGGEEAAVFAGLCCTTVQSLDKDIDSTALLKQLEEIMKFHYGPSPQKEPDSGTGGSAEKAVAEAVANIEIWEGLQNGNPTSATV